MTESFGERLRRTAGEMAQRVNEAAQSAGERLGEMREQQQLQVKMRALQREREQCKITMADLLIRMFDQQQMAPELLRPEYDRIKQIEIELAQLQEAYDRVGQPEPEAMTQPPATVPGVQDTEEPLAMPAEPAPTLDPSTALTPTEIPNVADDELQPEE